ncbi:MAG: hypothetical protein DRP26_05070, partial [Candidatus Zixiibacteriota bacterium]
TLRFLKEGYATRTINNVVVTNSGPTVTDIKLMPLNPVPPAPELIYPAIGDTLDINMFTFDWSDPVYSSTFLLEVSDGPEFETFVILDSNLTDSEYDIISPLNNSHYFWRVKAGNANGWGPYSETSDFFVNVATKIKTNQLLPDGFMLYQNRPNPFNSSTQISFVIPADSKVEMEIFDITGAMVAKLVTGWYTAGLHNITWEGLDYNGHYVTSGIYFCRLKSNGLSKVRKMLLLN